MNACRITARKRNIAIAAEQQFVKGSGDMPAHLRRFMETIRANLAKASVRDLQKWAQRYGTTDRVVQRPQQPLRRARVSSIHLSHE